jgi:hypothetical protein
VARGGHLRWCAARPAARHQAAAALLPHACAVRAASSPPAGSPAAAAAAAAEFAQANKETLRQLPPPRIALEYYKGQDLYMVGAGPGVLVPSCCWPPGQALVVAGRACTRIW